MLLLSVLVSIARVYDNSVVMSWDAKWDSYIFSDTKTNNFGDKITAIKNRRDWERIGANTSKIDND